MGRALHNLLRFLIGVVAMTLLLHFFGLSWTEVGRMTAEGLRGIFEVLGVLKENMTLPPMKLY